MADSQIPFVDTYTQDNTAVPSDVAGQAQTANVMARAQQTPQMILAGAQPQPIAPVAVPVATPPPDTSSKANILKTLATSLLAGGAGGASAPFGSSEGGARGVANYEMVRKQEEDQLNKENQQKQQSFQNQLAANQDQRASQLNQAQIAHANLQALDLSHTLSVLPLEDQERISKVADGIAKTYQDRGIATTEIEDSPAALAAYFKANPGKDVTNMLALPVHSPTEGVAGKIVLVPKDARGLTMNDLYKADPKRYSALKDNQSPMTATQFQTQVIGALNDEATKAHQDATNQYNQQQENHRAQLQRSTQIAVESMRERAAKDMLEVKSAQKKAENGDPSELADGAQKGLISPDELKGMGAKIAGAVKTELIKKGVDVSAMDREWDFAKTPQVKNAITAFNTLDGSKGDPGVLAKWAEAMKKANVSSIADLNALVKKGPGFFGSEKFKDITTANNLGTAVVDQYAKILNGTGASSDAARAQANEMYNNNWGKYGVEGAISAAKAEVESKKQAMLQQSRYLASPLGINKNQRDATLGGPQSTGAPNGAIGKAKGSDGKLHWTDGKTDLGVAE